MDDVFNMQILLFSNCLVCDEYRYGVHYHIRDLEDDEASDPIGQFCDLVAERVHLPFPNDYIPYNLKSDYVRAKLITMSNDYVNVPEVLNTQNRGILFRTSDRLFGHPRTALYLLYGKCNAWITGDSIVEITPYSVSEYQLNRLTSKFYYRLNSVRRYPSEVAGLDANVLWSKR